MIHPTKNHNHHLTTRLLSLIAHHRQSLIMMVAQPFALALQVLMVEWA
jgi:hypothetical protein